MRTPGLLLLLYCTVSCTSRPQQEMVETPSYLYALSPAEVSEVQGKIHLLKAGMTKEEAFRVLGLSAYVDGGLLTQGRGTPTGYQVSHLLRNGSGLFVTYDLTRGTNLIVTDVRLGDKAWSEKAVEGDHHSAQSGPRE